MLRISENAFILVVTVAVVVKRKFILNQNKAGVIKEN
jgi:hypothetical protein